VHGSFRHAVRQTADVPQSETTGPVAQPWSPLSRRGFINAGALIGPAALANQAAVAAEEPKKGSPEAREAKKAAAAAKEAEKNAATEAMKAAVEKEQAKKDGAKKGKAVEEPLSSAGGFQGFYTDPGHPKGYRVVRLTGKGKAVVELQDDPKGEVLNIAAKVVEKKGEDTKILIDFSVKGGPKDVTAVYKDGNLVFPDGNKWPKMRGVPGVYAVVPGPDAKIMNSVLKAPAGYDFVVIQQGAYKTKDGKDINGCVELGNSKKKKVDPVKYAGKITEPSAKKED